MKPYAYSKEEPEVCANTTCNDATEMTLKSIVGEITYQCCQTNETARTIERMLFGENDKILPGEDGSSPSSDNMSNALIDILRLSQATLARLTKILHGIDGGN